MNIKAKERVLQINMGQVPQGYKKTKVGIIPNEWPYDRFKNIVKKSQYGLSLAKNIKGNIKILDMSQLQNGYIINKDLGYVSITPDEYENYVIKKGDLLFNRTNSYDLVGKSAVAKKDYEFVFASYLVRFKFKEECNFQYIGEWFALSHKTNIIKRLVTKGVGQCNINPTELQKYFYIPLPPLTEQGRIAEILTTCDNLIELKEKLIEQKKFQKKYLMQALLDPKSPNFRQLIGFKDEWKEVKLGSLGKTYGGLNGKNKNDFGTGKPYIPYINIFNNPIININSLEYVVIEKSENQNQVKFGDIFFTTSSETPEEVGMSAVILEDTDELYLNSFCFGFRLYDFNKLNPNFAVYFFRSNIFRKILNKLSQGSTRFNLSKNSMMKVNIILPAIKEQTAIAKILSTAAEEIHLLESELEQQKLKKKALMQLLLTGKVRVNVSKINIERS